MELSYILEKETPPKKFLTFSQKKAFLIKTENGNLGKRTPRKKSSYFRKRNCLIFHYCLQARKIKKKITLKNFLYFGKWNFLVTTLKNKNF